MVLSLTHVYHVSRVSMCYTMGNASHVRLAARPAHPQQHAQPALLDINYQITIASNVLATA